MSLERGLTLRFQRKFSSRFSPQFIHEAHLAALLRTFFLVFVASRRLHLEETRDDIFLVVVVVIFLTYNGTDRCAYRPARSPVTDTTISFAKLAERSCHLFPLSKCLFFALYFFCVADGKISPRTPCIITNGVTKPESCDHARTQAGYHSHFLSLFFHVYAVTWEFTGQTRMWSFSVKAKERIFTYAACKPCFFIL